jgi:hypothetical protein
LDTNPNGVIGKPKPQLIFIVLEVLTLNGLYGLIALIVDKVTRFEYDIVFSAKANG